MIILIWGLFEIAPAHFSVPALTSGHICHRMNQSNYTCILIETSVGHLILPWACSYASFFKSLLSPFNLACALRYIFRGTLDTYKAYPWVINFLLLRWTNESHWIFCYAILRSQTFILKWGGIHENTSFGYIKAHLLSSFTKWENIMTIVSIM